MTTRPAPVAPDWLVSGAKVVVHFQLRRHAAG